MSYWSEFESFQTRTREQTKREEVETNWVSMRDKDKMAPKNFGLEKNGLRARKSPALRSERWSTWRLPSFRRCRRAQRRASWAWWGRIPFQTWLKFSVFGFGWDRTRDEQRLLTVGPVPTLFKVTPIGAGNAGCCGVLLHCWELFSSLVTIFTN